MTLIIFIYAICMIGTFMLMHKIYKHKEDSNTALICSVVWPMFWIFMLIVIVGTAMIITLGYILTFTLEIIWKLITTIIGTSVAKKDVKCI